MHAQKQMPAPDQQVHAPVVVVLQGDISVKRNRMMDRAGDRITPALQSQQPGTQTLVVVNDVVVRLFRLEIAQEAMSEGKGFGETAA